MPLPEQSRPDASTRDRWSRASYNFVPQPEKVFRDRPPEQEPSHDRFEAGRYSGYVPIKLTSETWCYIRAAVSPAYAARIAARPDPSQAIWEEGSEYRHFFHHGDPGQPVIPGSEVRGMVRQLVEVMAAGRLSTGLKDALVYRDVGGLAQSALAKRYRGRFVHDHADRAHAHGRFEYPMTGPGRAFVIKGGYLFRSGRDWFIQPATPHQGETFVRVDTCTTGWNAGGWPAHARAAMNKRVGLPVWVRPAGRRPHQFHGGQLCLECAVSPDPPVLRSAASPPGYVPGVLLVTDRVRNKDFHCVIYEPCMAQDGRPVAPIAISDTMQRQYVDDAALPRGERTGRILAGPVGMPPGDPHQGNPPDDPRQGYPCFYMLDARKELVFFGGSLFFRIPYDHAPGRFVPHAAQDDLPRQVFGTVAVAKGGEGGEGGVAGIIRRGRVRFEDLLWRRGPAGPSPWVDEVYVSPATALMQPKPTAVQHYLVQPDPALNQIRDYHSDPAAGETTLRGFKHYWHRRGDARDPSAVARRSVEPLAQAAARPEGERKFRTVVRPVREGTVFEGRVYFDNVDAVELGALLMALDLPAGLRHKIGLARALGFGSIKIDCGPPRVFDDGRGSRTDNAEQVPARYQRFFQPEDAEPDPESGLLECGWRADWEEVRDSARRAFGRAMVEFEGVTPARAAAAPPASPGAPAAGRTLAEGLAEWQRKQRGGEAPAPAEADPVQAFWSLPRMVELKALLSWDAAPSPQDTDALPLGKDWRDRKVLPPPSAVRSAAAPAAPVPRRP